MEREDEWMDGRSERGLVGRQRLVFVSLSSALSFSPSAAHSPPAMARATRSAALEAEASPLNE